MTLLSSFFVGFVATYVGFAALTDLRARRIPNYLTVPAAVLGILFHTFMPQGWGLMTALSGFTVGFGLLLLPWLLGGGGMGDIKLLAALGAWLGPNLMIVAFAASIVLAALGAMIVVGISGLASGMDRTHRTYISANGSRTAGARSCRRILPFAIPVALSTWGILAWIVASGAL